MNVKCKRCDSCAAMESAYCWEHQPIEETAIHLELSVVRAEIDRTAQVVQAYALTGNLIGGIVDSLRNEFFELEALRKKQLDLEAQLKQETEKL